MKSIAWQVFKMKYRRVFSPASLYRRDSAGRRTKWVGKTNLRRTLPPLDEGDELQ